MLFIRIYILYFKWMLCNVKGEIDLVVFSIFKIYFNIVIFKCRYEFLY